MREKWQMLEMIASSSERGGVPGSTAWAAARGRHCARAGSQGLPSGGAAPRGRPAAVRPPGTREKRTCRKEKRGGGGEGARAPASAPAAAWPARPGRRLGVPQGRASRRRAARPALAWAPWAGRQGAGTPRAAAPVPAAGGSRSPRFRNLGSGLLSARTGRGWARALALAQVARSGLAGWQPGSEQAAAARQLLICSYRSRASGADVWG